MTASGVHASSRWLLFYSKRGMRMLGGTSCLAKVSYTTLTLIRFASVVGHAVRVTHWIGLVQSPRLTGVKKQKV
jgi:hypothetical protein